MSASKSSTAACSRPQPISAHALATFWRVTLPLSLPGVMTGVSLVPILLLGEYLIPQMLGGGKVYFIGNALVDLFVQSRNWPFGSAIAVTLVVAVVIVLGSPCGSPGRSPGRARWTSSDARCSSASSICSSMRR